MRRRRCRHCGGPVFVDVDRFGARTTCMLCARGHELQRVTRHGNPVERVSPVFGPRRQVAVARRGLECPRCETRLPDSAPEASWLYCMACGPIRRQG